MKIETAIERAKQNYDWAQGPAVVQVEFTNRKGVRKYASIDVYSYGDITDEAAGLWKEVCDDYNAVPDSVVSVSAEEMF